MSKTTTETKVAIRPLGDRVIVRRDESETKSPGGIMIPDSAKHVPRKGVVLAVGNGVVGHNGERIELELKDGDYVVFDNYAGHEVEHGDETLTVLREHEVIGILE